MTNDATTTHKPLTETTWADFGMLRNRHSMRSMEGKALFWPDLVDLAYLLADGTNLTVAHARVLVDFVHSGMPMVMEWANRGGVCGLTEVRRATVLADDLMFSPSEGGRHSYMHIRYTGFGHTLYLSHIRDIQAPSNPMWFEDPETGERRP